MTAVGHDLPRLLIAALAFVLATLVARRIALATGFVAQPNKIVSSHRAPVPYLGGAALIVTLVALVLAGGRLGGASPAWPGMVRALAALALCTFGVWDDRRPLGPGVKMLVQLVICGAYLALVDGPLGPTMLVKLLVLVTMVNAFNLIDVMDGLLCLLSGVVVVGLLATPDLVASPMRDELMVALVGFVALFLFNAPPARIYAGDAGSLPLGFLVGAWCLAVAEGRGPTQALSLLGLAAVPLLELALLFTARLSKGRSPFRGSPDHFSLRLQDQRRWNRWQVLAASAATAAFFALAPLAAARWPGPWLAAYGIAALGIAAILWWSVWKIPPAPGR